MVALLPELVVVRRSAIHPAHLQLVKMLNVRLAVASALAQHDAKIAWELESYKKIHPPNLFFSKNAFCYAIINLLLLLFELISLSLHLLP
jgi:hypothetical protein